ncbi:tail sheath protein, partial [Xanthomonas pisi]|uniref:tail sheath protein n=1 Tax=Xanthomonas pisi TaxID=56457 RepID=UPI00062D65D8
PQPDDPCALLVRRTAAVVPSVVLSTKRGDRDIYGSNIFFVDFFAQGASHYIFATAQGWPKGFSGVIKLNGGLSSNETVEAGDLMEAWDLFADRESVNAQLFIAGSCAGESLEVASTVQKHVVAIGDS